MRNLLAWKAVRRPAVFVCCLSVLLLVAFSYVAHAEEHLFSGRALSLFKKGKKEFARTHWKEAEEFFKESKKEAEKDGKKVLSRWLKACKGGKRLDKAMNSRSPRKSLAMVTKLKKTYRDSPLSEHIEKAYKRAHRKVYYPLSTFDGSPDAQDPYASGLPMGAEYVSDRDFVRGGASSVKWRASPDYGAAPSLPLGTVNGKLLDDYDYMNFWIYSPDKTLGKYIIIFNIDEVDVLDGDGDPASDCFFKYVTVAKKGWTQIRFDLDKELSKFGAAKRAGVKGVHLLMLPFSHAKTIYVDEVMLERR